MAGTVNKSSFIPPQQIVSSPAPHHNAQSIFMKGGLIYEMPVGKHAFPVKDDGVGRAQK